MRRKCKLLAMVLFVIIMCAAVVMPTGAEYIRTGSFDNTEGGFIGIGATTYTYVVYRDSVGAYVMYHNKDLCNPLAHTENRGTIELSVTNSIVIKAESSYQFSKSLGLDVAISKLVGLAASVSRGLEFTTGLEIHATGSVGVTLPPESPTGHYKLTPCQDFHQRRLDKYKKGSTLLISSEYCFVPEDETYWAPLYSPNVTPRQYAKY